MLLVLDADDLHTWLTLLYCSGLHYDPALSPERRQLPR